MNSSRPNPISIPWQKRWHHLRVRLLPVVLLVVAIIGTVVLWKGHAVGSSFAGQAEPVLSNVSCYKPGVVAELNVRRFERVKAGDVVGEVVITEPRILSSSLAVIEAQIEMLRADLKPVAYQQRTAMDYDRLRLDWMQQRAQLAAAKVNLQLAETEYRRMEGLFKDQIVSERVFEQAKAARDRLQNETQELTQLVCDAEKNFQLLQPTNAVEISKVSTDPLKAAIAVEESKLRLTEAELAPLTLKAPIDGVVTMIYHRSGEAVTAGQPIIAIATLDAVRIVGYLRPPLAVDPKVGMDVEVHTRGPRREIGNAKVIQVGTQFETVPATLLGPINFANIQMGLPVDISMPPQLKIRPGEIVDVRLTSRLQ